LSFLRSRETCAGDNDADDGNANGGGRRNTSGTNHERTSG
jgi:hypothetical protein